jgi:signal-transduction protein with cAMP-binding, CBS, and nucleotidyltransferase domain
MANIKKFMEAATDAIYTNEITDEASGLVATIAEGLPLDTIIKELHEYSQALSAMVLTKILHTLYDSETIDEMITEYGDSLAQEMFDEIDAYLQKEGN